jgi:hypothetical protein
MAAAGQTCARLSLKVDGSKDAAACGHWTRKLAVQNHN